MFENLSDRLEKVIKNIKGHGKITEENIQAEIDLAGILAGMELEQVFDNEKMIKSFNEGYCELVLDKGDVKYN